MTLRSRNSTVSPGYRPERSDTRRELVEPAAGRRASPGKTGASGVSAESIASGTTSPRSSPATENMDGRTWRSACKVSVRICVLGG